MRRLVVAGLLLALTGFVRADEDPPDQKKPETQAEKFAALQKEIRDAQKAFNDAYRKAEDDAARSKVLQSLYPNPAKYATQYMEIATQDPSSDTALKALVQVLTTTRSGPTIGKALGIITEHHLDSSQIASICQRLVYTMSLDVEKFLEKAMTLEDINTRAQACFSLARFKKSISGMASSFDANPDYKDRYVTAYGKEFIDHVVQSDPKALNKEVEELFVRVTKEFGDVKSFRGTLGEAAEGELFEIRNLAIGKTAPNIEGEDIDGQEFQLTDYRGKVVVLDFWGDW